MLSVIEYADTQSHSVQIMYLRYATCVSSFSINAAAAKKIPLGKKNPDGEKKKICERKDCFPPPRELIKTCIGETKPTNPFEPDRTACTHASTFLPAEMKLT